MMRGYALAVPLFFLACSSPAPTIATSPPIGRFSGARIASAAHSFLQIEPPQASANGESPVIVTLFLLDEESLPVPSVDVSFFARGVLNVAQTARTENDGRARFVLSSRAPGEVAIEVVASKDGMELARYDGSARFVSAPAALRFARQLPDIAFGDAIAPEIEVLDADGHLLESASGEVRILPGRVQDLASGSYWRAASASSELGVFGMTARALSAGRAVFDGLVIDPGARTASSGFFVTLHASLGELGCESPPFRVARLRSQHDGLGAPLIPTVAPFTQDGVRTVIVADGRRLLWESRDEGPFVAASGGLHASSFDVGLVYQLVAAASGPYMLHANTLLRYSSAARSWTASPLATQAEHPQALAVESGSQRLIVSSIDNDGAALSRETSPGHLERLSPPFPPGFEDEPVQGFASVLLPSGPMTIVNAGGTIYRHGLAPGASEPSWIEWSGTLTGASSTTFLADASQDPAVFYAVQGSEVYRRALDADDWTLLPLDAPREVLDAAYDETHHLLYLLRREASTGRLDIAATSDRGATWALISEGLMMRSGRLAVDSASGDLWFTRDGGMMSSRRFGQDAWQLRPLSAGQVSVRDLAVSWERPGAAAMASEADGVFVTEDGGAHWTSTPAGPLAEGNGVQEITLDGGSSPPVVYAVIYDPATGYETWTYPFGASAWTHEPDAGAAFVSFAAAGGRVFALDAARTLRYRDGLGAWQSTAAVAPPEQGSVLALDPRGEKALYIAGDNGIHKLSVADIDDPGATWQQLSPVAVRYQAMGLDTHGDGPARIYALEASGLVRYRDDAMLTSEDVSPGPEHSLSDVSFTLDPSTGTLYLHVNGEYVLLKRDSGEGEWRALALESWYLALFAHDGRTLYAQDNVFGLVRSSRGAE